MHNAQTIMTSTGAPKRSIFTKPSWASKANAKIPEDNTPIFGKNTVYEDIVAEERRRRERHAARTKERGEKQKDAIKVGDSKKRRISKDVDEREAEVESDSDVKSVRSDSNDSNRSKSRSRSITPHKSPEKPTLRSAPYEDKVKVMIDGLDSSKTQTGKKKQKSPATIVLDDDEEEEAKDVQVETTIEKATEPSRTSSQKRKSEPHISDPESEEDDPYLRDLKRKARQEARSKRLGVTPNDINSPGDISRQGSFDVRSPSLERVGTPHSQSGPQSTRATATPDPVSDPKVQIRIKTIVPGARELIVSRHASQPLDKVKEYWCQTNNLPPAITSKVFFTWNGTKLYNSTTMRGIIERLKKTKPVHDGSDPSGGKIEIEAMTEEIFQYRIQQKERRRKEAAGIIDPSTTDQDNGNIDNGIGTTTTTAQDQEPGPTQPPQNQNIIIVLKAQDSTIEELQIRVRPYSTVAKLITAFRLKREIPETKECWLMYDGDRLQEHQTCEELGFEGDDTVEVYFR